MRNCCIFGHCCIFGFSVLFMWNLSYGELNEGCVENRCC
ncbi:hypothetical protein LINPERHAP1_LOCUS217, partial [Linum perenne]